MYAVIGNGEVEYDINQARVPIDEMIESLQAARDDGAEYVLVLSGNNRGAKYELIGEPDVVHEGDW